MSLREEAKMLVDEYIKLAKRDGFEVEISKVAYQLYTEDWLDTHTTLQERSESTREYDEYVRLCLLDDEDPVTYEEFLFEFGFNGSIYACYEEFCDMEYHDKEYITELLESDELVALYYKDIENYFEETEDLSVVDDVLRDAIETSGNGAVNVADKNGVEIEKE